ncbi:hypothetical protein PanWU01x14_362830 [Parasponia andersonii]|uniref:Uncharacterized protein n=1 Tax=Parasponia andersonii TaxID=3476 RepID=A0A2P5A6U5_PARAD|nr:hypothetical protein PanWU01x14_362830 [Parasponia andersonii]
MRQLILLDCIFSCMNVSAHSKFPFRTLTYIPLIVEVIDLVMSTGSRPASSLNSSFQWFWSEEEEEEEEGGL